MDWKIRCCNGCVTNIVFEITKNSDFANMEENEDISKEIIEVSTKI